MADPSTGVGTAAQRYEFGADPKWQLVRLLQTILPHRAAKL